MKYVVQIEESKGKWKDYMTKTSDKEAKKIADRLLHEADTRARVVIRDDKGKPA